MINLKMQRVKAELSEILDNYGRYLTFDLNGNDTAPLTLIADSESGRQAYNSLRRTGYITIYTPEQQQQIMKEVSELAKQNYLGDRSLENMSVGGFRESLLGYLEFNLELVDDLPTDEKFTLRYNPERQEWKFPYDYWHIFEAEMYDVEWDGDEPELAMLGDSFAWTLPERNRPDLEYTPEQQRQIMKEVAELAGQNFLEQYPWENVSTHNWHEYEDGRLDFVVRLPKGLGFQGELGYEVRLEYDPLKGLWEFPNDYIYKGDKKPTFGPIGKSFEWTPPRHGLGIEPQSEAATDQEGPDAYAVMQQMLAQGGMEM